MLYGVEVRRLDAVDHGVELHGLAQRGVCVAVYVAKKILIGKKKLDAVDHNAELDATDHGVELDTAGHGAELFTVPLLA